MSTAPQARPVFPERQRKPASSREAEMLSGVYLTPKDLSVLLKICERTVTRYLEQGKLPGTKIGSKWRTRRTDLDRL